MLHFGVLSKSQVSPQTGHLLQVYLAALFSWCWYCSLAEKEAK